MENLLKIHSIGYNTTHPNGIFIERTSGIDTYLFLYIKSNVRLLVDGEYIDITEPAFVLFDKNIPQCYYTYTGPYIDDWMHFDGECADEFLKSLNIPLNTPMVIRDANEISSMLANLYKEVRQEGIHHEQIIDSMLRSTFYKFSDIYNIESNFSDKMNRYRQAFNEIRNRIYNYSSFDNNMSVDDIASTLNISTSYFQHIYKQLFGVSIMRDIIESRIEFARHLLQNNYDSITDIASRCGYENKEHFTRQFKDVTGYTPKQFRQNFNKS